MEKDRNKGMRKALIVTALAGFIRSFLTHDIELLQGMGYEVHCAANMDHPGSEGMGEYFFQHNVIFHQVDFSSYKPVSKETLIAFYEMRKLKNEYNFQVVHCHTPIVGVIVRCLFNGRRRRGCKVIYTTHGFYFHKNSSWKTWFVFYNIENAMSRFCDAIITINREDYRNAQKMRCKRVFHINGVGVDITKYRDIKIDRKEYRKKIGIPIDSIVVLAVGELSKRKNQKVVIEALGIINNPNVIMVHCGNAMNDSATTEELLKLAIDNKIELKLMGLRNDIPEICKCADIGTISSTREGLGLAGIEMLASGLPIVGSNVHGIVDYIIDGYNGYLANPLSSEDFAAKISILLNKEKRNELSKNCCQSVKKFDCSVSHKQMETIYKLICNN